LYHWGWDITSTELIAYIRDLQDTEEGNQPGHATCAV
jgi:hypothetical protein